MRAHAVIMIMDNKEIVGLQEWYESIGIRSLVEQIRPESRS